MRKIYLRYLTTILLVISFLIIIFGLSSFQREINDENTIPVNGLVNNKIAYLTFDDGPSENTLNILDILDKYQIKATFFVVGPSYKLKNDLLTQIVNRGHKLAIHSYEHNYSEIYQSKEAYIKDFELCLKWIKKITGTVPTFYRFPGGSSNTITSKSRIVSIINELYSRGFTHVDWNIDSFDSHYNKDTNAIIKSTINCLKTNETNKIYSQTILMHDNTKKVATIEALPQIIEYFQNKGYTFEPLNNHSK